MTKKKLRLAAGALVLLLSLAVRASAQSYVPIPGFSSTAYEASHVVRGTTGNTLLYAISVSWTVAEPHWLMVFNSTSLPANGVTTSCGNNLAGGAGCLAFCMPLSLSTDPINIFKSFDWTWHPKVTNAGMTVAVSTTNCSSLTIDGAADWFDIQAVTGP